MIRKHFKLWSADFFQNYFFKKLFEEYGQSIKQFGCRSEAQLSVGHDLGAYGLQN